VAVIFVLRVGDPWYAIAAALAYYLIPAKWLPVESPELWTTLAFGVLAVVAVVTSSGPGVLPVSIRRRIEAWKRRFRPTPTLVPAARALEPRATTSFLGDDGTRERRPGIEVVSLTVRYGGVIALDHVSLAAPTGRVTGLIGPNGSGKTTLFNACSGLVRPAGGKLLLHGRDLARSAPAARARRGIGRTFQLPELFDSLSVRETVALGREAALAGGRLGSQLIGRRGDQSRIDRAVAEAVELTGIEPLLGARLGALGSAERRLVELARCLAGPFDVLLLDEPSAGLDRAESERFVGIVRDVVSVRDAAVLLVEHDMSVVMGVCEYIYVLDFGELVFEGDAEAVRASSVVRAAYLGSDELEAPTH
ncbi:MAG: ABC transporter ATP-binding protein, partial [Acidimicrobiia bacterium]